MDEAIALCKTTWRYRETQVRETLTGTRQLVTRRRPTKHILMFVAAAISTCSRSARIYEASYISEVGRPWADLKAKLYYRAAPDETVSAIKQAPTIPIGEGLLKSMIRRHAAGDRYVVEFKGKPVDCKKAFVNTVERARKAYPKLFRRPDGTPKQVVRHTLRHTGITWRAIQGIDPLRNLQVRRIDAGNVRACLQPPSS